MALFVPAEPFHPGEYLDDELKARNWTHDDLAAVTGISRRQIINLIQGKSGITPETALALQEAFGEGHDAMGWMKLQAVYELAAAAQKDRDVQRRANVFNKVPVRELIRRGWIPSDVVDVVSLEQSVCSLLRTNHINEQPTISIAARKGTSYDSVDSGAHWAWYGRAFQLAQGAPAATFSHANLESGIVELLKLAAFPEDTRQVPKVVADMGIRLVFIEHLRHTKIDGAAFWLDKERETSPVVAMSLRYDRIDYFWFTLLHEIMHIKFRDTSPIDIDNTSSTPATDLPEMEVRANRYAAQRLVREDKLRSFIGRKKPFYYEADIIQFAQVRKVHPGIVVGQLQNNPESGFDFKQLRRLLVKVREFLLGNAITDGWKYKPSI